MEKMSENRYCYYVRVSTKEQEEKRTYEVQINEVKKYAESLDLILSTEYRDIMSGKSKKRPKFNQMLQDLKSNYKGVIVAFVDRLGRDFVEQLRTYIKIYDTGKEIHVVDYGRVNQDNLDDQFKYIIESYFSAKEIERHSDRIKGGIERYKKEHGRWGPKKKEIDWELFERLERQGLNREQLARVFEMCRTTLYRRIKEEEDKEV